MIKSLNLEIIDICNLKCKMCNIWENKSPNYLNDEDIENILSSKYINKNIDISITWWEPLLHSGLKKVLERIYALWFQVSTISTNWIMYEKLNNLILFFKANNYKIPNIHISIDWDEKNHDRQRWIEWSYLKSIETIIKLKKEFKNINIKIKYTITNDNIKTINYSFLLSKKLWVDISFKLVENDENYTNKIASPSLPNHTEKEQIYKELTSIYWNENKYINNLLYYIKNNTLNFECKTVEENLFIMANWDVYPCTKYDSIWNIRENSIDDILFNIKHNIIVRKVKNIKCTKCFSLHWSYKSLI